MGYQLSRHHTAESALEVKCMFISAIKLDFMFQGSDNVKHIAQNGSLGAGAIPLANIFIFYFSEKEFSTDSIELRAHSLLPRELRR